MSLYILWKVVTEQGKKQADSVDVLIKCNVTGNAKKQLGCGGKFWSANQYNLLVIEYGTSEKNTFLFFFFFS